MLSTSSKMNNNNSNFILKHARSIEVNCNSRNSTISEHSDFIDEDYSSDCAVKNNIPEMKLLPMDYVPKAAIKPKCSPPLPPTKCKCVESKLPIKVAAISTSESSPIDKVRLKNCAKYLVYKKKHSIFGGTTTDMSPEKLKYISDNTINTTEELIHQEPVKSKENKRKYLIFDSKKNGSDKLDSIQYYFDNKSYEKYVDDKLYGKINQLSPHSHQISRDKKNLSMKGFENSRSWEYRDNNKTENKLKLFETKQNDITKYCAKSDDSTSGASSCSETSLKQINCRLKSHQKCATSKSISDVSLKTSHDVSRINQLFLNAKQQQQHLKQLSPTTSAMTTQTNVDKEKYKIHRKLNSQHADEQNVMNKGGRCLNNGDLRKHSSTATAEPSTEALPSSSCGFMNCKFSDNSQSTQAHASESCRKFNEKIIKKLDNIHMSANVNKTNISVNGKSNIIINDTKNIAPNEYDEYINGCNKKLKEPHWKANNQNKTTIKINDSCFVANQCNDIKINNNERCKNVIQLNSEKNIATYWDKNIKGTINEQPKYFDKKIDINSNIRNVENSVKIYVTCGVSPTLSRSSQDSSDSDRDYGYFDTSSQEHSSSPEFVKMFKKFRQLCTEKSTQVVCDGSMFWNNSYLDDDETIRNDPTDTKRQTKITMNGATHPCTKCRTTDDDLLSNYICICRKQVKFANLFFFLTNKWL